MDEARAVLARLECIDLLKAELLDELRSLVYEAEAWARVECDTRAEAAAAALAERAMIAV